MIYLLKNRERYPKKRVKIFLLTRAVQFYDEKFALKIFQVTLLCYLLAAAAATSKLQILTLSLSTFMWIYVNVDVDCCFYDNLLSFNFFFSFLPEFIIKLDYITFFVVENFIMFLLSLMASFCDVNLFYLLFDLFWLRCKLFNSKNFVFK